MSVGAIAAVVSVVALAFGVEGRGSARRQVEADAKVVLTAAHVWKEEQRLVGCPTLSQLMEDDALDRSATVEDPWGNRFRIRCDGGLRVLSVGEDGEAATDDDIAAGS